MENVPKYFGNVISSSKIHSMPQPKQDYVEVEFEIKQTFDGEIDVKVSDKSKLFNFTNDFIMNEFKEKLGEKGGIGAFRAYMMINNPDFFKTVKTYRNYKKDMREALK